MYSTQYSTQRTSRGAVEKRKAAAGALECRPRGSIGAVMNSISEAVQLYQ